MQRLLVFILISSALAVPATAWAQHRCETRTRLGSNYASKATSGECTVSRSKLLGTATLRCGGTGSALVRYAFQLPSGCAGSGSAHVDASGDFTTAMSKPDAKNIVRLTVRGSGNARVVIAMASVSFYCV